MGLHASKDLLHNGKTMEKLLVGQSPQQINHLNQTQKGSESIYIYILYIYIIYIINIYIYIYVFLAVIHRIFHEI